LICSDLYISQVLLLLSWTDLVGGISVLDDPVGTDNNTIDVIMLHQRAEHGVAYTSVAAHEDEGDLQIMVAGICRVVSSNEVRRDPNCQLMT
jgi:hypothetical protein